MLGIFSHLISIDPWFISKQDWGRNALSDTTEWNNVLLLATHYCEFLF